MKPFKNRTINPNLPVMVYKNLHNGLMSIRQAGKVVAHAPQVRLNRVSFKVSEAGRQRVIAEGKKNVHAFVVGYLTGSAVDNRPSEEWKVTYNPYKYEGFVWNNDKTLVKPCHISPRYVAICDSKLGVTLVDYE